MNQDLMMILVFWMSSGVTLGGVITPILASSRGFNEWLAMIIGVGAGVIGNLFLLLPLWALLMRLPVVPRTRPAWEQDLPDAAPLEGTVSPAAPLIELKRSLWPAPRTDQTHSHRITYVGVFAALVIITLIEVALSVTDVPFSVVGPLVALSTTKVILVVLYFMHLRFDSRWYAAMFLLSLPFAAMVLTVLAIGD